MIFARLETNLLGAVQFNNAAIAVTLFLLWLQRAQPRKAPDGSKPRSAPACATRAGPAGSKSSRRIRSR